MLVILELKELSRSTLERIAYETHSSDVLDILSEYYDVSEKVAMNPYATKERLARLANSKDPIIRREVAANPNSSKDILTNLSEDPWNLVRNNVAANPSASKSTLEKLASSQDEIIQNIIAKNPSAGTKVLEMLAQQGNVLVLQNDSISDKLLMKIALGKTKIQPKRDILLEIIRHPNVSSETLYQIAKSAEGEYSVLIEIVRSAKVDSRTLDYISTIDIEKGIAVAKNPNTNALTLDRLARENNNPVLQKLVALHPNTKPETIMSILTGHYEKDVKIEVMKRKDLSQEAISFILKHNNPFYPYLELLAENDTTPPEILEKLAQDWNFKVAVASNPNASKETLDALAEYPSDKIDILLASNPSLNPETHKKLARANLVWIRAGAAKNSMASPEILAELADDRSNVVKIAVAGNKNTSPETLAKLADDCSNVVKIAVAGNKNTSPKTLEHLANECEWLYETIAANPQTNGATLAKIAMSEKKEVRILVAKHHNTTSKTLEFLGETKDYEIYKQVVMNPNISNNFLKKIIYYCDDLWSLYTPKAKKILISRGIDRLYESRWLRLL